MDHGQVALHAGQQVEGALPRVRDRDEEDAAGRHQTQISRVAVICEDGTGHHEELHEDPVVGEDVCMARLGQGMRPPPLAETQTEDEEGEWEEDRGSGDDDGPADTQ